MDSQPIDSIYLPFSADQLRNHFVPTAGEADRHLRYYLASAEHYQRFRADHPDRCGLPLSELKTPCQIEKDERFWVVTCLMSYFYSSDQTERLGSLMSRCFGDVPPLIDVASWDECLGGRLHLFFEVKLPSPPSYRRWLGENLSQRQIVPYVLDASYRLGTDDVREGLEGPTQVDAVLLNENNGFAIFFEAKVLSDISYQVSFDAMRNQIARNIDVMLEQNLTLSEPLSRRDPHLTLFVLLTPEMFREHPHSRLYGWLLQEYRSYPTALERDIPHRQGVDWQEVARRIGWLTWEDCEQVLHGACPWLPK